MGGQPLIPIDTRMADGPKSPRKTRIEALLVMAKTVVVALKDTEKGNWQWQHLPVKTLPI